MNYIGSKRKLVYWIEEIIKDTVGEDLSNKVFCDMFAGTGIVGRTFKPNVKKVISNDLEYYSFVVNKNYIENSIGIKNKEEYIDKLNSLPLVSDGFIYQNYCKGSGSNRLYFTDYNGKKIDTIRREIEKWYQAKKINDNLYYFLLTSLIESADKKANTTSVYGAFLKEIKESASKKLILSPAPFLEDIKKHNVYNKDSNLLIETIKGDILYLDPPYNNRNYGANYHILNTIAKYDNFIPKGITGLREYNRSAYYRKSEVRASLEYLIKKSNFQYIFLSYNNEGLLKSEEIKEVLSKYGHYSFSKKMYQRYKSDSTENRNHKLIKTYEHLHILEKKQKRLF